MPVIVSGIKFWGVDVGEVLPGEIDQISSPPDSILHLLRHLVQVPDSWSQQMIAGGVTTLEFIQEQIRMPGSKWNVQAGLLTPEDVILFSQNLLRENKQGLRWVGRGQINFCYLAHQMTVEEKAKLLGCSVPMGKKGIVFLQEIPKGLQVTQHFNRGGNINVVVMALLDTDEVVITLARRNTGIIQIYSAFPGILTPPVPRQGQEEDEFKYNKQFWQKYALIESKGG